jgi:hypothetical protein
MVTGTSGAHPFEVMTHADMATLAREYLMAGHMIDRAGMPHLIGPWGRDVMTEVAIDEWMGASPVYTRRMQQALDFAGTDVATMFKGMQLDVGAPPEFLDFRYTVHDADHGEFRLDHCGALMDVEPMGDDFVLAMCHTIEDPTFEATACASNPQARMAPVHRPPRSPANRHPHCHWTITIDHDAEPLAMPATAHHIASSLAAAVEVRAVGSDDGDHWGRTDYAGDLDPDLRMEDFSSTTLSVIAQEACVQAHLLVLSFQAAIAARYGDAAATDVCRRQFTGAAGLVARRLARAFDLPADASGLVRLLNVHPAFHPLSYVDWRVTATDGVVRAALGPCDALAETVGHSWLGLLTAGHTDPLAAIARQIDDRYDVHPVDPASGEVAAWEFITGEVHHDEFDEVTLARFSTGDAFVFARTGRRNQQAQR